MDEALARQLIRRKLLGNRLPRGRALHLSDAPGQEQICDGCGQRINPRQKAIRSIGAQDWVTLHFHANCYELWDIERLTLAP